MSKELRENKNNLARKISLGSATLAATAALYGCCSKPRQQYICFPVDTQSPRQLQVWQSQSRQPTPQNLQRGMYNVYYTPGKDTLLKDTTIVLDP